MSSSSPSTCSSSTLVFLVSVIGFCAVLHQWHRAEQNLLSFRALRAATARMSVLADQEKQNAQQARGQVISAVVSQQVFRNPSPSRKEWTQQIVRSLMGTFESGLEDYKDAPELYSNAGRHDKARTHWNWALGFQRRVVSHFPPDWQFEADLQSYQRQARRHNSLQPTSAYAVS